MGKAAAQTIIKKTQHKIQHIKYLERRGIKENKISSYWLPSVLLLSPFHQKKLKIKKTSDTPTCLGPKPISYTVCAHKLLKRKILGIIWKLKDNQTDDICQSEN